MVPDRLEHGLDARVVRAARDDDADLARAQTRSPSSTSSFASIARAARRPTTSGSRTAGMPLPGRFVVSIAGSSHGALRDRDAA